MHKVALLGVSVIALAGVPLLGHAQEAGQTQQAARTQQTGQAEQTGQAQGDMMDVALDFVRGNDVLGAEGEEVGDVTDLVRSADGEQGLFAVVRVETGWFEEERHIVAQLDRFTITEDGLLRLENLTEDTIDEYDDYVEDEWEVVGEEYDTFADAYEGFDWV